MFKEDETQYCKNCYELTEQLNQLKAENEELKVYKSMTPLKVKMLVKTLTEIKEIAEVCSFTDSNELLLSRLEQILQKISEVEDE